MIAATWLLWSFHISNDSSLISVISNWLWRLSLHKCNKTKRRGVLSHHQVILLPYATSVRGQRNVSPFLYLNQVHLYKWPLSRATTAFLFLFLAWLVKLLRQTCQFSQRSRMNTRGRGQDPTHATVTANSIGRTKTHLWMPCQLPSLFLRYHPSSSIIPSSIRASIRPFIHPSFRLRHLMGAGGRLCWDKQTCRLCLILRLHTHRVLRCQIEKGRRCAHWTHPAVHIIFSDVYS